MNEELKEDRSTDDMSDILLRTGQFSVEEEEYANVLVDSFLCGNISWVPRDGKTLRSFLAKRLHCDPMRISKKFAHLNNLSHRYTQTVFCQDCLLAQEKYIQGFEKIFLEKDVKVQGRRVQRRKYYKKHDDKDNGSKEIDDQHGANLSSLMHTRDFTYKSASNITNMDNSRKCHHHSTLAQSSTNDHQSSHNSVCTHHRAKSPTSSYQSHYSSASTGSGKYTVAVPSRRGIPTQDYYHHDHLTHIPPTYTDSIYIHHPQSVSFHSNPAYYSTHPPSYGRYSVPMPFSLRDMSYDAYDSTVSNYSDYVPQSSSSKSNQSSFSSVSADSCRHSARHSSNTDIYPPSPKRYKTEMESNLTSFVSPSIPPPLGMGPTLASMYLVQEDDRRNQCAPSVTYLPSSAPRYQDEQEEEDMIPL
mmetsp:Transcript_27865/g.28124  ORF Transcript_27865/g.28124 Transcript_27865/m.28124 type:complete len:415 (+) Transcript_27865:64-1308(+)